MLKRLGFSTKIAGGFGAVIVILLALGATSLYESRLAGQSLATYADWSELDMVMNEAVIANTLRLQTAAHDYAANKDEAAWSACQDALKNAMAGLDEWRQTIRGKTELESAANRIGAMLADLEKQGKNLSRDQTDKVIDDLLKQLDHAMEGVIDPTKEKVLAEATANQKRSFSVTMFFTLAGAALSVLAAMAIIRATTKPVYNAIDELSEGTSKVTGASRQIAVGSQMLAQNAAAQAAALEQTHASLEELTAMTGQNADNSTQANSLMKMIQDVVNRASGSMSDLTASMNAISEASEKTSRIVKTIDEIAFQTNLLALNAAVEAARAGEAGAGFAVVAGEVRTLAQRAAEAARDTAAMIDSTVERVTAGETLVKKTSQDFTEVAANTGRIAALIGEINLATSEQSRGLSEINTAVGEMDRTIQQIAANAEESASAAEELNSQLERIDEASTGLQELVGGGSATRTGIATKAGNNTAGRISRPAQNLCWQIKNCPTERRDRCPAYPDFGDTCWKVTGTQCGGKTQGSYDQKITNCRNCDVYKQHSFAPAGGKRQLPMAA